jgi:hypothetical protein
MNQREAKRVVLKFVAQLLAATEETSALFPEHLCEADRERIRKAKREVTAELNYRGCSKVIRIDIVEDGRCGQCRELYNLRAEVKQLKIDEPHRKAKFWREQLAKVQSANDDLRAKLAETEEYWDTRMTELAGVQGAEPEEMEASGGVVHCAIERIVALESMLAERDEEIERLRAAHLAAVDHIRDEVDIKRAEIERLRGLLYGAETYVPLSMPLAIRIREALEATDG